MKRLNPNALQMLAVASQLGFLFAACVLVGLVGGYFLDQRFGTSPLWLAIGCVVGLAAGVSTLIQTYKFFQSRLTGTGTDAKGKEES